MRAAAAKIGSFPAVRALVSPVSSCNSPPLPFSHLGASAPTDGTFSQTNCLYGIISLNAAEREREREREREDEHSPLPPLLLDRVSLVQCEEEAAAAGLLCSRHKRAISGKGVVGRREEGGRNGNDGQTAAGNGKSRLGGQSGGKSRPFSPLLPSCSRKVRLRFLKRSHVNNESRPPYFISAHQYSPLVVPPPIKGGGIQRIFLPFIPSGTPCSVFLPFSTYPLG